MVRLRSSACGSSVFPAPALEKTVLSPPNGPGAFVDPHVTTYGKVYFWTLFNSTGPYVRLYTGTVLFYVEF